jgi:hypothetical protein
MIPANTDAQNATVSAINGTKQQWLQSWMAVLRAWNLPPRLIYSVLSLASGGDHLNLDYNEILKGRGF